MTSTSRLQEGASLTGWGGLGLNATEVRGPDLAALTQGAVLSRGMGRSYGDAALPPSAGDVVVGTTLADKFLAFDAETGVLRAQAGVSLQTIKRVFLPRNWFVPVTPGTAFVTLGGMVASDVHGKNHHVAGTIGRHVRALLVRTGAGEVLECSRTEHSDLFLATLGGMGLTGHILEVELQLAKLPSPWIWSSKRQVPHIEAFLESLAQAAERSPMTVGWIDCLATGANLGRGYLWEGRWAEAHEAPAHPPGKALAPTVPFRMPNQLMNRASIKLVNEAIFRANTFPKEGVESPDSFFYPLDDIHNWNLLYGRRGFTQHQAMIPHACGRDAVVRYVELIARLGGASPLCVLKDCGPEGDGLLSWPKPGVSVALDLPMSPDMPQIIHELNRYVLDHGGRVYLTKDAFTTRDHFEAMEADRLPRFQEVRRTYDPDLTIRSALSVRLFGDPPEGL